MAASGTLPDALLKELVTMDLKFTRLDLAIDARGLGIDLKKIKAAVKRGDYEGRRRKWLDMENSESGYSLYIGSPTSERRLRVYHKGAEQGFPELDWVRLEDQLRSKVADTIARAFSSGSMGNLHSTSWAIADQMLSKLQSQHWREFSRATDKVWIPPIRRTTDLESWLIQSVAPSIRRLSKDKPDSPALKAMREALAFGALSRGE
jgi:DNA relaxase NicK